MTSTLFLRLDARDRALLTRWAIGHSTSRSVRLVWLTVTHLGGAVCAIALAVLPLLVDGCGSRPRSTRRRRSSSRIYSYNW
jgi:hypothetical protein